MQHLPDNVTLNYPRRIRSVLLGVVGMVTLMAYLFPRFSISASDSATSFDQVMETFDIPPTVQFTVPPRPTRPQIPVASEDEDLAEEISINETNLEDFSWDAPPSLVNEGSEIKFVAYEVPPKPIGGIQAIIKRLEYPMAALEAGIEGRVVVQALIDETGSVTRTVIAIGIPDTGMDEAAAKAISRTRFEPALQRDRPLAVWIAIPIVFSLTSN